jgi:hypothetical protein
MTQMWLSEDERRPAAPYMAGMLNVGGDKYLPMGGLMPYNAVASLNPRDIFKFSNPVAQATAAGVFGVDPKQRLRPLSYAPESRWLTAYGQEDNRPSRTEYHRFRSRLHQSVASGESHQDKIVIPRRLGQSLPDRRHSHAFKQPPQA